MVAPNNGEDAAAAFVIAREEGCSVTAVPYS
jgi:hypothetical protein